MYYSEVSYYTVEGSRGSQQKVKNRKVGDTASIEQAYLDRFCSNPYDFDEVIEVGKHDKLWTEKQVRDYLVEMEPVNFLDLNATFDFIHKVPRVGDVRVPGIETIWNNIGKGDIFQVTFIKGDKALSKKEVNKRKQEQLDRVSKLIWDANVKNLLSTAEEIVQEIQENPVLDYEPGQERVLIGYKKQFHSADGYYAVCDMEKPGGDEANAQVNLNTIKEIIVNRVKYIVK